MADKEVMVFAVSQFSSVAAALHPAPPVGPRPKPEDLFNALDTGSKGYLTQADLQSAIVKISDQGAKLSAADAQAQAQEIFSKLDKNGDGKATLAEFKQAAPDGPPGGRRRLAAPPAALQVVLRAPKAANLPVEGLEVQEVAVQLKPIPRMTRPTPTETVLCPIWNG